MAVRTRQNKRVKPASTHPALKSTGKGSATRSAPPTAQQPSSGSVSVKPRQTTLSRTHQTNRTGRTNRIGRTPKPKPVSKVAKSVRTKRIVRAASPNDTAGLLSKSALSRQPPPVSESTRRAARNLLSEIGGETTLLTILDDSEHPNAPKLADLIRSDQKEIQSRPFGRKILDAGLTPSSLAEILYDRQKTKAFVQATMDIPDVVAGIIRRAKDRFERCGDCQGWGRRLTADQRRDQLPPDAESPMCLTCDGIGWNLVSGETEAVELFLELVRLRKSGQQVYNDFSKKMLSQNQFNNPTMNFGGGGNGAGDGQPPSIDTIIKRADEQKYLPAAPLSADQKQSVMDAEVMPEETELVGE